MVFVRSLIERATNNRRFPANGPAWMFILVLGFAPISKPLAQETLSDYMQERYLQENMSRISSLLYESLLPTLSITDPRKTPNSVRPDVQLEVIKLIDRTTKSAAALSQENITQGDLNNCDFSGMSVDLRGIRETLSRIHACVKSECTSEFLSKEQARLLFFADQLDKKREVCPIYPEK